MGRGSSGDAGNEEGAAGLVVSQTPHSMVWYRILYICWYVMVWDSLVWYGIGMQGIQYTWYGKARLYSCTYHMVWYGTVSSKIYDDRACVMFFTVWYDSDKCSGGMVLGSMFWWHAR